MKKSIHKMLLRPPAKRKMPDRYKPEATSSLFADDYTEGEHDDGYNYDAVGGSSSVSSEADSDVLDVLDVEFVKEVLTIGGLPAAFSQLDLTGEEEENDDEYEILSQSSASSDRLYKVMGQKEKDDEEQSYNESNSGGSQSNSEYSCVDSELASCNEEEDD